MFIGHFAFGLAAKKAAPSLSLGTLFLSVQLLDLLWPTFLLLGMEKVEISPGITAATPLNFTSYPISHSLIMALVWGILAGGIYYLVKRNLQVAVVIFACVISHWFLDLLMHRPDLPLVPGSAVKVGLGLWNSIPGTLILELTLFFTGIYLYLTTTKALNKAGNYAFWSLIIFLFIIYISNIFGPPPPSVPALAWVGESQWLIIIWAYWADKNRSPINYELKPS
ncbi:metal-dependent hydrolase [Pedobacter immunditicola]|uniref:metal-dependent hydrolase n=1 Tax=Pedobacter immunditicola TaxID=3133440 RepID=UPI0030B560AB